MVITRRGAFGLGATAAIGSTALVATALAATRLAAAAPGVTQESAGYQTQPNGDKRCAQCTHFQPPAACQVVQGTIVPNGWCKLFAPKSA